MNVRVKICGITNPADAELAASLGADMIGVNFYAKSPRFVNEATAKAIVQALPPSILPVALFVNEPLSHAWQVASSLGFRAAQVHGVAGEELPQGMNWIPAYPVKDAASVQAMRHDIELWTSVGAAPYAVLLDAHVPGMYGGTGQTAPWHLLADFQPGVHAILAGGLTPENVTEAIRIVKPFAVDVASGVECAPGKKDRDKMRRFIDAAKE